MKIKINREDAVRLCRCDHLHSLISIFSVHKNILYVTCCIYTRCVGQMFTLNIQPNDCPIKVCSACLSAASVLNISPDSQINLFTSK